MSEDAPAPEIQINVKGPSELKLQITISTDKTVLELKHAIAAKSSVEADRQRLIYSGRVLKDEDALSVYKIQSSHTIHMVKGVSRAAASSSQSTPQQLPAMQAGQNPHDPLTLLNSHLGYGAMAGINPFAGMGLNPNDPNMLQAMMNSPEVIQQMSNVLRDPAVLDQILSSNPQLAAMAPHIRQTFQSDQFREMLADPDRLRQLLQTASALRGAGLTFPQNGGFPVPNANPGATGPAQQPPNTTPGAYPPFFLPPTMWPPGFPMAAPPNASASATGATGTTQQPASPTSGSGPAPFNMFTGAGVNTGTGGGATQAPGGTPPNHFGPIDPALMQQLLASSAFGGTGYGVPPPLPADTRPPEERFQVQLQQLQDMGFTNASQNIRALLATGGNVHSAIEYILGGGGL